MNQAPDPAPLTAAPGTRDATRRGTPGPARLLLLGVLVFLAAFAWLRGRHLLLPQAGIQAVLASDALLEGRGLELDPGVPFSKYPPLYPLLLAPLELAGLDVIPAVYALNAATLALTLCLLWALGRGMGLRHAWIPVATYALLGSTHYLLRAARGDAIPIAMSLATVLALSHFARSGSRSALLAAAAACAVAGLARYMAIFSLIPIGLVGAWWLAGSFPARRWRDTLLFALVAGAPPALWLLRNQLVKGAAFGIAKVTEVRAGAEGTDFASNVRGLYETVLVDLFGYDALGLIRIVHGDTPMPYPTAAYVGALIALIASLALAWSARARLSFALRAGSRSPREVARTLLVAYLVLYVCALIAIWTVGQNDPMHTRYVAPLYAPLLLLALDVFQAAREAGPRRWQVAAAAAALLVVLAPNVPKSARLLGDAPDDRLIEITSRRGLSRWHDELTWNLRGGGAMDED